MQRRHVFARSPVGVSRGDRRAERQHVYRSGMLLGLALSLAAANVLVQLPWIAPHARVAWLPGRTNPSLVIDLLDLERHELTADAPPATRYADVLPQEPAPAAAAELPFAEPEEERDAPEERGNDVPEAMRILNYVEVMPEIDGGIRSYYLNIEYPEEARRAGIEGQLLLSFVVEPDGQVSSIRVNRSLHPLCDSAAVQALRRTRFAPGRHDGVVRRVRMHLPVRFELIDAPVTQGPTRMEKSRPVP